MVGGGKVISLFNVSLNYSRRQRKVVEMELTLEAQEADLELALVHSSMMKHKLKNPKKTFSIG